MKIDEKKVYKLYMEWVNKVSDEFDWKTTFGPKEIVNKIVNIIETYPELIIKE